MPFDSQVACRVSNIAHRLLEKDEKEIGLVELTLEINPLTVKLAGELHDFVRRTLFTVGESEVTTLLGGATFRLPLKPQEIQVRIGPDQKTPSFTIDESKIASLKAKRSKKSAAWTLEVKVIFAPTDKQQLAQVVEAYTKMRYLTFADAAPDLFAEEEKKSRRGGAAASTPAGATAH